MSVKQRPPWSPSGIRSPIRYASGIPLLADPAFKSGEGMRLFPSN